MSRLAVAAILFCSLFGVPEVLSEDPNEDEQRPSLVAETHSGLVEGAWLESKRGRPYAAFMSVPYARPPLGELRFKAPKDVEKWEGVKATKDDAPFCIQNNPYIRQSEIMGQEDCLYLNVYTPEYALKKGAEPLPVMVFFHGGGWMCGSGNKFMYGPDYLMDHGVVYVGVNYRLSFLGMFSTMDEAAPGNWALKDQSMALRWIKKNIKRFGGNPDSVTIFGESAGGSSVHYHMLSPKSKGLFHRAVLHSGVALNVWANASPKLTERFAQRLGRVMKCPTHDSFKLVECLRTKKAEDLVAADSYFYDWDYDPMIPFRPVIEPKHKGAFLVEDPRVLLKEGRFAQVPVMMGLVENEGALRASQIFGVPGLAEELSENFDKLAPITFDYQTSDDPNKITKAIKDFYFGGEDKPDLKKYVQNLTDVYTDAIFLSGMDEALRLQLPQSLHPIFFYRFKFSGSKTFSDLFGFDKTKKYGACHVDDMIYLLNIGIFSELNGEELTMSDTMCTIWTNFAMSGNPSVPKVNTWRDNIPVWPPLSDPDAWLHVEIGPTLEVRTQFAKDRRDLWRRMPLWQYSHSKAYENVEKDEL